MPDAGIDSAAGGTPGRQRVRPEAAETRRLYAADWAAFERWCATRQQAALPAAPATVAAFLAAARNGLGPGALARRAAAINSVHRRHGLANPAKDPAVAVVLREARQARPACGKPHKGRRRGAPGAPSAAQLARMAAACDGTLAGLRDRALLRLLAAGVGRDALLRLHREGVELSHAGAMLRPGPPADGEAGTAQAADAVLVRPAATFAACPVRALDAWLRGSDTRFGPVFRKVDRWGNVEHGQLSTDGLRRILLRRALGPRRQRRAKPHGAAG